MMNSARIDARSRALIDSRCNRSAINSSFPRTPPFLARGCYSISRVILEETRTSSYCIALISLAARRKENSPRLSLSAHDGASRCVCFRAFVARRLLVLLLSFAFCSDEVALSLSSRGLSSNALANHALATRRREVIAL